MENDSIGIVADCGDEGTGKTTMALTFPKPLVHFDIDVGGFRRAAWRLNAEGIESKSYPKPIQIEKLLGQTGSPSTRVLIPKKVEGMKELWQQIVQDFVNACMNKEVKTIVMDSATLLWNICLHPDTRVLKANLTWAELKNISVGDELVGIEETPKEDKNRKMTRSMVEAKSVVNLDSYAIILDNNITIIASGEHQWLRVDKPRWRGSLSSSEWITTNKLEEGMQLKFICSPWETDNSYEAGYLSGILDGEGHVEKYRVEITQKDTTVLNRCRTTLANKGFSFSEYSHSSESKMLRVMGLADCLRFIGSFRPSRLLNKAHKLWENKEITGRIRVIGIVPLGKLDLISIQTTSRTFIAEGVVTHNCHQSHLQELQERQLVQWRNRNPKVPFDENEYRERLQPIEYGPANDKMRTILHTARSFQKNLVLTHYPTDEYGAIPDGKGNVVEGKTGNKIMDGFKETLKLSDLVVWLSVKEKSEKGVKTRMPIARIAKCGLEGMGLDAVGLEIPATYEGIINLQRMMRGE